MIVKVQCPLIWLADRKPTILIYNKSRTVELQAPFTKQWQAMFVIMAPALKLFFRAEIDKDNKLNITGRPLNYDPGW